ncbi:MAG: hypothetical protein GY705_23075 [Bacteroidetes bacterium]|nr:hypothetical protein [Bacteroidota bacterium]
MTQKEQQFIELLDKWELDIFSYDSLKRDYEIDLRDWKSTLRQLRKIGYLQLIEKGKYCRHYFRNEHVISNYLVSDGVVAYWSALNLHGMTEQFTNTVFVQTTKLKKEKRVFGVSYKFIKVLARKMTGMELRGFGNHQFRITDKEKTIVDCFDLPQYSGGYERLFVSLAEESLDQDKLITYSQAIDNIAATKRLAFLMELFKKPNMESFLEYALGIVNKKYSLFHPFLQEKGKFNNKWRLRLNMSEADILEISNTIY